MNLIVNRRLTDKPMDHIDHALGRPLDPTGETYRNFFTTDGPVADELAASPHWIEGRRGTGMRCFAVTDDGRKALADHLKEIGDAHRSYVVTFDGHDNSTVAVSAGKARYDYFLTVCDVMPDLTFKEYCRRASVRVLR